MFQQQSSEAANVNAIPLAEYPADIEFACIISISSLCHEPTDKETAPTVVEYDTSAAVKSSPLYKLSIPASSNVNVPKEPVIDTEPRPAVPPSAPSSSKSPASISCTSVDVY